MPLQWLFSHLKLIDLTVSPGVTTDIISNQSSGKPEYVERWELTEKGRKLWKTAGLEIDYTSIPVARRTLIEVSKMTAGDRQNVTADYRWRLEPNEIGACFIPESGESERLPAELRDWLKNSRVSKLLRANFALERAGEASIEFCEGSWQIIQFDDYEK